LTPQQVAKIDRLYDQRVKAVDPFVVEEQKQRAELERMIGDRIVDPSVIELQVGRVEAPHAKVWESRIVMLYRMWLVLTPDQYTKFQAYRERTGRGRSGGGGRL
jgi:Spy/CpxP family protein refolding chaperone